MLCEAPKYTETNFLLGCPADPAWGAYSAGAVSLPDLQEPIPALVPHALHLA